LFDTVRRRIEAMETHPRLDRTSASNKATGTQVPSAQGECGQGARCEIEPIGGVHASSSRSVVRPDDRIAMDIRRFLRKEIHVPQPTRFGLVLRDLGLDPMNAVAASVPAFRFHCAHNRDDRESRYKVDP
jgi:hypothetical protein